MDVIKEYSCRLCSEINLTGESTFHSVYENLKSDNKFFETENFQVMVPVGPLFDWHLLLVPKRHYLNIWECYSKHGEEFDLIKKRVIAFLKELGDLEIVEFEHGAITKENNGGCCLSHAHLNIVATNFKFDISSILTENYNFFAGPFHEIQNIVCEERPYLYFFSEKHGTYYNFAPKNSTQFFRRIIYEELGMKNWDWRSDFKPNVVKSIVEALINFEGDSRRNSCSI
jgi:diadenosine tetraphosphate (Ap4A) HIT family hydrolase